MLFARFQAIQGDESQFTFRLSDVCLMPDRLSGYYLIYFVLIFSA